MTFSIYRFSSLISKVTEDAIHIQMVSLRTAKQKMARERKPLFGVYVLWSGWRNEKPAVNY